MGAALGARLKLDGPAARSSAPARLHVVPESSEMEPESLSFVEMEVQSEAAVDEGWGGPPQGRVPSGPEGRVPSGAEGRVPSGPKKKVPSATRTPEQKATTM